MLRNIIRVLAILVLLGSSAIGAFATYVYLTPSDEQRMYDQRHQEAMEKLQRADSAKGTAAEDRLAKEAREAVASAQILAQASRERDSWNRLGVLASGSIAFVSLIVVVLTFVKRKNNAGIPNPGSLSSRRT